MATKATFLADFASFQAAVQKADVQLKGMETSAGKVGQSLNRMVDSFSGRKIVQEAETMTRAYQTLASKGIGLTDSEMRRMNATISEAIAKMKAGGKEIPADMQKVADATKRANTQVSALGGFLKSTFAQFTLASLASRAIQDVLGKMSEFIATGAKLPAMEASFKRLTSSMKQDGDQMLANLRRATLGLVSNFDLMASANKAMLLGLPVTSQAMGELAKTATVLGRAMGQDATKSLDDLITALGRSSPMILDNLGLTVKVGEANEAYARKLGKTTEQLTDAEKKMAFYEAALEAARVKVATLGEQTRTLGEISQSVWVSIGNAVSEAAKEINTGIGSILSRKESLRDFLIDLAAATAAGDPSKAISLAAARAEGYQGPTPLAPPTPKQSRPNQFGSDVLSFRDVVSATEQVRIYQQQLAKLTVAERSEIEAALKLGDAQAEIAKRFGVSEGAVALFTSTTKGAAKATKDAAEEAKKNLAIQEKEAAARTKYNDNVIKTNELLTRAMRASKDATTSQFELNRAFDAGTLSVNGLLVALKDAPIALQGIYTNIHGTFGGGMAADLITEMSAATKSWTAANVTAGVELRKVEGSTKALGDEIGLLPIKKTTVDLDGLARSLAQLSQVAGSGIFSGLLRDLSTLVSAVDTAQKGWETFDKGLDNFRGGGVKGILSGITGMASGILGIASAAIVAGKALVNLFDRNKGRDVVKEFAAGFGGFDALHRQLATLGDEGEKLWIQLTQGVGRNNPTQARAAIDAINKAFETQKTRLEEAARALETVKGKVTDLVLAHLGASGQITPALQAQIDKLVEMGRLTEENAAELLGLTSEVVPAFADVSAAAATLGLNIDSIGGKISNMAFADKVGEVRGALETLESAGADMAAVFIGSVEKIQPLVTEALKFGREMPEEMRPWLQQMVDSGLLVDENGEKLEDLSRLSWAEPLSKKFDDLIVKIGELIDSIAGKDGISATLDELGRKTVRPRIEYQVSYTGGSSVLANGGGSGGGGADGGYVPVTIMTPNGDVLAQEVVRVTKRRGLN